MKHNIPPLRELRKIIKANNSRNRKALRLLNYRNIIYRPVSVYLMRLFLIAGVSADMVTLVSYVFVIAAGVLLIFGNYQLSLIGLAIYILFGILDFCDGDISRYLYGPENNPRGKFIEDIGHRIMQPFIIICLAFGLYNSPRSLLVGPLFFQNMIILVIGLTGACLGLILHVLDYYPSLPPDGAVADGARKTMKKRGLFQQLTTTVSTFRVWLHENQIIELVLLITVATNTTWLYLALWVIIPIPLLLINAVVSYRHLPKPRVIE